MARGGGGPTLVEAKTFRYGEHAANMGRVLVDREGELAIWRDRDPIDLHRANLLRNDVPSDLLEELERDVVAEIDAAVAFARESAEPDLADAFADVFDEPVPAEYAGTAR
ncbi:MAG: hypothetical protein JWR80_4444 [Bradyrhizobium sp.]|nr:hypothetical protein [Bradyrhizobium sp.]